MGHKPLRRQVSWVKNVGSEDSGTSDFGGVDMVVGSVMAFPGHIIAEPWIHYIKWSHR